MPPICRDRSPSELFSTTRGINSPKPSRILSQTASVASGVTSRRAGPVPPVVTTRQHFSLSRDPSRGFDHRLFVGNEFSTASQVHERISLDIRGSPGRPGPVDALAGPVGDGDNADADSVHGCLERVEYFAIW